MTLVFLIGSLMLTVTIMALVAGGGWTLGGILGREPKEKSKKKAVDKKRIDITDKEEHLSVDSRSGRELEDMEQPSRGNTSMDEGAGDFRGRVIQFGAAREDFSPGDRDQINRVTIKPGKDDAQNRGHVGPPKQHADKRNCKVARLAIKPGKDEAQNRGHVGSPKQHADKRNCKVARVTIKPGKDEAQNRGHVGPPKQHADKRNCKVAHLKKKRRDLTSCQQIWTNESSHSNREAGNTEKNASFSSLETYVSHPPKPAFQRNVDTIDKKTHVARAG
jgi:hypothetical protein